MKAVKYWVAIKFESIVLYVYSLWLNPCNSKLSINLLFDRQDSFIAKAERKSGS